MLGRSCEAEWKELGHKGPVGPWLEQECGNYKAMALSLICCRARARTDSESLSLVSERLCSDLVRSGGARRL